MADYTLTVYQDDDTTVLFEVGTAADHAHPYLKAPSEGKSAEVDVVRGTASIGQQDLEVVDPQTGAAQADRWLTALLGTAAGYSALNGRRAVRKQVSPPAILMDGVVAGVSLLDSFAGFRLAVRDIRERGVKLKVFTETTSCTVLPRGVLRGYGALPGGGWVVPPTKPLVGTYRGDASAGAIELDGAPKRAGDIVAPELVVTDAMRAAMRSVPRPGSFSWVVPDEIFDQVSVLWRPIGGADWTELRDIRAPVINALPYLGGFRVGGLVPAETAKVKNADGTTTDVIGAKAIVVDSASGGTLPTPGQRVEVVVRYRGPISKDYPLHFEGGWGEFVRNMLRGDYGAVDETGARVSPRFRYDEATLLAMGTPIRVRLEEPKDDLRSVLEELCVMIGAAPAVDDEGRLAPILAEVPDAAATLAQIDDTNARSLAGWEHPTSGAVTQVTVTYPRDYAVPAGADPNGERSAGDGVASREVTIVHRAPQAALSVMGVRDLKIDAWAFRALGAAEGAPASGDVTNEQGAQLAAARAHQAIDRFAYGGVSSTCQIAAAAFPGLKIGDWVLDARSWRPNYATGKRGGNALAQVVSLRQKNPAWYEVRLVDAAPSDNPAGQPTLGAISVGADGVISVAVTAIPADTEARVDYAISETVPTATAPGWTFLGRTGTPGTLKSPPLPAGAKVWIRARGEGVGRRPSAWTVPVSATAPGTPRILSADLEVSAAGTPTATWVTNASAKGVRVHYAAHPEGQTPTLTAYVDAAAASGTATPPVTVRPGEAITIEVEPWTGWTGAAVSGTAGDRVRRTTVRPDDGSAFSILRVDILAETDTTRTLGIYTGAGVEQLLVFEKLVQRPAPESIDPMVGGTMRPAIIVSGGYSEITLDKPKSGWERHVAIVGVDSTMTVRGMAWHHRVDPVAPRVEAELHATVTDGTADVSLSLHAAPSVYPVTAEVFEDSTAGTPLLTHTFAADGSIDATTHPALADRPLPLRAVRSWFARLTDVAGAIWWAKPATADRDSLPAVWPTPASERVYPYLDLVYDDDTDSIRVTVPDGRTRTYSGLAGSGVVRYTVGDVLDDASTESGLGVEERRSPYTVEALGGGEWRTIWSGPLSGPPRLRVIPRPSQLGSTGTLTLEILGDTSRMTGVWFKSLAGAGDLSLSNPVDGTWTLDPAAPYATSVDLVSLHTSVVGWAVGYTDGSGVTRYEMGSHTFTAASVAQVQNILISFTAVGLVVVSTTGNEDAAHLYVTVGIDADPADPTAAVNHGAIAGRVGSVETAIAAGLGTEVRVNVVGANAAGELGPVMSGRVRRGERRQRPRLTVDRTQSGSTLVVSAVVDDPTRSSTAVHYATKTDAGDYGAWTNLGWSAALGVPGTDATLTRQKNIALTEGHSVAVKIRVQWIDESGATQEIIEERTGDADQVADVSTPVLSFDIDDLGVVSVGGDEDTDAIYVTAAVDTDPADPTTVSYQAMIAARSGSVSTGVECPAGSELRVKARGWNDLTGLGPVKPATLYHRRTPTLRPRITSASVTQQVPGTCSPAVALKNRITVSFADADGSSEVYFVNRYENGVEWGAVAVSVPVSTLTVDDVITGYTYDPSGADIDVSYLVSTGSGESMWTQILRQPRTACP